MQTPDARKRSVASRDGTDMICSILEFLDASPGRLLDDLSSSTPSNSFFKTFLFCVLSPDQSIRRLATSVAERLFTRYGGAFQAFSKDRQLGTHELRKGLWSRR